MARKQTETITIRVTSKEKNELQKKMKKSSSPSMRQFILDMCMDGKIIVNDELKKLYASCGQYPMINQTEISPRNSFKDIIHFCQDNGIQVEAYSPFGRGNLVEELMNDKDLLEIGKNHNKTVGQVVLRWIVQQNIIVIPRSTNYDRLKQNLDIFDFELTNEEMNIIDNMNQNRVFGVNQINKYKR